MDDFRDMQEQTTDQRTMAEPRFDAVLNVFAGTAGRRAALRLLAASTIGGALAPFIGDGDGDDASAGRRARRRGHVQRRHRKQAGAEKKKPKCAKAGQKPKNGKPCCPGLVEDESGRCRQSPAPCDVCGGGCPFATVQEAVDAAPGPIITICAGTYSENVTIDRDLTLNGAGDGQDPAANTILDGGGSASVVTINGGVTVVLQNLRLSGGNAEFGGGVRNTGDLTMSASTVSENAASFGGGIYNDHGTLALDDTTVSGNTASDSGGGLLNQGGTVELSASTLRNNTGGFGGGIDNENGTLTIDDSSISGNTANNQGGGIFADGPSTVTISNSTVTGNTASQEGGGIAIDDTVVTMTLIDSTVSENTGLNGGGIFSVGNLTLTGSTVSLNKAVDPGPGALHGDGGGIANGIDGVLMLEESTVTNNDATNEGGGIANAGEVACSDAGAVSGNSAGTAGAENCFDDVVLGGSGCSTCNA